MIGLIRQIIYGVFVISLIGSLLLIITFLAFPLQDWEQLWTQRVFDLPYAAVIIIGFFLTGLVCGLIYHIAWHGKLQQIEKQLLLLMKGQLLEEDDLTERDLSAIMKLLLQLQEKIKLQVELSQRLATERAKERENSLQEVIIQERNRLARELHDSVSQQLFAASMMMSAINETTKNSESPAQAQLAIVENMIQQTQLEMRALLLHLRPIALKDKSLQEGIKELLEELIQKAPLQVDWKIENFLLDKGIEDHLFRILQESISNTLRHANATSLHVLLIKRDNYIIMRIIDNGIGFDVNVSKASSYGLQNMRERALEIGGTLQVISVKNQGTRIEVKVPSIAKEGSE